MNISPNPNSLLSALTITDQVIMSADNIPWINPDYLLMIKRERENMFKLVDQFTQPGRKTISEILAEKSKLSVSQQTTPSDLLRIGFILDGEFMPCDTHLDICQKLLTRLFMDYPEKRETIVLALRSRARSKKFILNDQETSFKKLTYTLVKKNYRKFLGGWYFDKKLSPEYIKKILPIAARASGLEWGLHIEVIWP